MKILVKAANWLGDAVMSLPTLESLREMNPSAHLAVLARRSVADVYRDAPYIDETLPYERALAGVKLARRGRFDVAIVLPRSFSSALMVFSARVPRRIGYRGDGRSFMLTDAVPRHPDLLTRHRVYYYHHLLRSLGTPPPPKPPHLGIPEDARSWARELLAGEWIALNPGATYGPAKQWYPDRFVAVARELGRRVVVVGGPAEAQLGGQIAQSVDGALNLAGRTSIAQLAAVVARCRLLLTNDTGPMHVADAVGTPLVAVFGPTDPVTTPPFGERHTIVRRDMSCSPCLKRECPFRHHNCMKLVTVDEVVRACEEWLK